MTSARPRVAIDARYLSHGLVGGVHTYVTNLVRALLDADTGRDYILVGDTKRPFEITGLPAHARVEQLPWSNPLSSVRNDARIGQAMRRLGADVLHFPANYGFGPANVPAIITLHDAINLLPLPRIWRTHSRHPRTVLTMTYLHLLTSRAVARDPLVVTVSAYSRAEILRHSRLAPDRVRVVPSAPDDAFRLLPEGTLTGDRLRQGLRERVLLADAIKNPACVLRAYRALPADLRSRTSLVFFARRPPSDDVQRAAADGECVLLLRPSQEELVRLYNIADLFLFPSWYEGFGLPVLEAMACGTPVIASDRGSLPEVVGDAGHLADAEDHRRIAELAGWLLTDPGAYREYRSRALAHAARYTWAATARDMCAIYDEALLEAARQPAPPALVHPAP